MVTLSTRIVVLEGLCRLIESSVYWKLMSPEVAQIIGVGLGVRVAVGEGVKVGVLVGVLVAVSVGVKVGNGVLVGPGVSVGPSVGVEVLVGVKVGVLVGVKVGVIPGGRVGKASFVPILTLRRIVRVECECSSMGGMGTSGTIV